MIHDPILIKLVNKQSDDMNGAPEEVRVKNFNDIVARQKELKEMNRGGDD